MKKSWISFCKIVKRKQYHLKVVPAQQLSFEWSHTTRVSSTDDFWRRFKTVGGQIPPNKWIEMSYKFILLHCISILLKVIIHELGNTATALLQWNPDFSNPISNIPITWLESCQKVFPWICFTVILPPIFQTPDLSNQFSFPLAWRFEKFWIPLYFFGNLFSCVDNSPGKAKIILIQYGAPKIWFVVNYINYLRCSFMYVTKCTQCGYVFSIDEMADSTRVRRSTQLYCINLYCIKDALKKAWIVYYWNGDVWRQNTSLEEAFKWTLFCFYCAFIITWSRAGREGEWIGVVWSFSRLLVHAELAGSRHFFAV